MPVLKSPFSTSVDTRLRVIGPFVLFLTGFSFFRLKMYMDLPRHLMINQVVIALSAGYIGWELARLTVLRIQQRLPGLHRITPRIFYLIVSAVLLAHVGFVIRRIAHNIFDPAAWEWPSLLDYSGATGVVLFYSIITVGIYEGAYLLQQWKQTSLEKEKLIQSEWQAKYDLLRAQINPHFLFNSLNSLSGLISENPEKAEAFTDEMSRVYRYLLKSSDRELVTLADELQFIRSYAHLLQVRHADAFSIEAKVDPGYTEYLLPALTLQLLVENAVKHNVVDREHPLIVTVATTNDAELVVINNIRKKNILIPSTGMGLNNINTKYRLLNLGGLSIDDANGVFTVKVPLIKV
jgi:hypothetical protein